MLTEGGLSPPSGHKVRETILALGRVVIPFAENKATAWCKYNQSKKG